MVHSRTLTIDVTAHSPADAATLYEQITDGSRWPVWSPLGSFALEKPGTTAREGVGAIRVFRTGPVTSREQIVELVPGRRLGYVLLSGLPLRDYRADIDLIPTATGTDIRWRARFVAALPGTGALYRGLLAHFIQRCANGLAAHTAQAADGHPQGRRPARRQL